MNKLSFCGIVALLWGCSAPVQAAPFTPASDSEVVQKLSARCDAAARRQRAELARDPQQLPLALSAARASIQRARLSGDPRELGLAQAALSPWWALAEPPPAVRLLRATVRQSQHDFAAALLDLDALVMDSRLVPVAVQAQAGLTRVAVLQVTGQLALARQACVALRSPRFEALGSALSVAARACAAELRSLDGEPEQAARELAALAREAPQDHWLALLRAELAQRMGSPIQAQQRFLEAMAFGADIYTVAAYADWLLDAARPREALALLQSMDTDADALLLRRAIALHRLRDPQAPSAAAALAARFNAARQRGESLHAREEARLALDVFGDTARALSLARENWQRQKEPSNAVLLWRAAAAAGQPQAAAPLWVWVPDPARVDVRLSALTKEVLR